MSTEAPVTHERYLHQAQFALFGCQMVEEGLKSFLMNAREVNQRSSAEYAKVSKSDEELDELPMGGLVKLFKKVLPNSQLIAQLEQLRPERNHCAHRALVLCFMSDIHQGVSLDDEFQRLCNIRQLAWSCFEEIKPECFAAETRLAVLRSQSAQG